MRVAGGGATIARGCLRLQHQYQHLSEHQDLGQGFPSSLGVQQYYGTSPPDASYSLQPSLSQALLPGFGAQAQQAQQGGTGPQSPGWPSFEVLVGSGEPLWETRQCWWLHGKADPERNNIPEGGRRGCCYL
jgi:hypothetical protein